MLLDLIRALPVAVAVYLLPGWFWARLLRASADRAEQAAFSVALSVALVPAVLLVPTRLFGMGITLAIAVAAPLCVFATGLVAYLRFGAAKGSDGPLAPPPAPLGTPALALLAAALALALGVIIGAVPGVPIVPLITVGVVPEMGVLISIIILIVFAGIAQVVELAVNPSHRPPNPDGTSPRAELRSRWRAGWCCPPCSCSRSCAATRDPFCTTGLLCGASTTTPTR